MGSYCSKSNIENDAEVFIQKLQPVITSIENNIMVNIAPALQGMEARIINNLTNKIDNKINAIGK